MWCDVGRRVRSEGCFGTVRWRGRIPGRRGSWYGVEWDSDRGKHDGRVDGVRYFDCPEGRGSFVRRTKLDEAISCADAVRLCYRTEEDESTAAVHRAIIDDWKRKIRVPFVEMVGFESVHRKQSDPSKLREVCVSDRSVWTPGELRSLCPRVETLDLSKNLLGDWSAVAEIVSQLPSLRTLDLSKNRLALPASSEETAAIARHFRRLDKISLAGSIVDWDYAIEISPILASASELVLADNEISTVTVPISGPLFENLTALVLDGNPLRGWEQVLKLGGLKILEELSLNDCGLKTVLFDDEFGDAKTVAFPALKTLYLKNNLIDDWRSISELNKLESLHKLYINKNPIVPKDDYDTASQLVVARIENLKELNGSAISPEARRGAEYDYLKKYGLTWKRCKESSVIEEISDFALHHSRFDRLVERYGLPDDNLLRIKKETWAISSKLIEVSVRDESTGMTMKKRVPATMSVQKLIALARRIFSQKSIAARTSTSPSLFCVRNNSSNVQEVLIPIDNEMKELDFYSICDGDVIVVRW